MDKITVIDSPCGAGKTTWCINYMKENINKKHFIYVTPFLSEINRVKNEIPQLVEPTIFKKRKYDSLSDLLIKGKNIITTHSLFGMCNEDLKDYIKDNEYELILDEVMDVVSQLNMPKDDIEVMLNSELIKIEEDGLITWLDKDKDTSFNNFGIKCKNRSVYYVNKAVIFWTFPAHIFQAFKKVIISTYMYDYQIQKYYYDFFKISYEKKSIENRKLVPYKFYKSNTDKIHICKDVNINLIGNKNFSLSKSWYQKREKTSLKILQNSLYNYFHNIAKAKSNNLIWTTYKDFVQQIKGNGYTKGYLPCNTRSTNEYIKVHYIGYVMNRYLNPNIKEFFRLRNIKINEDMYALSEMIQFIYRAAIRNNEDCYFYIPSKRMRELLENYIKE